MIQEISKITGLKYDVNDADAMALLRRISQKLPQMSYQVHPSLNNPAFIKMVKAAKAAVESEPVMIEEIVEPKERKLKIKSSPKGERIKVAAPNGVRYSYGPVWNESVKKAKGIAVADANREKLLFQASMYGVKNAAKIKDVADLCAAIVKAGKL